MKDFKFQLSVALTLILSVVLCSTLFIYMSFRVYGDASYTESDLSEEVLQARLDNLFADTPFPIEDTLVPIEDKEYPAKDTLVPIEDKEYPAKDTLVPIEDRYASVEDTALDEPYLYDDLACANYMESCYITVKLTAYCACERCCLGSADGVTATGTIPVEGRTIAVDPSVIPYGSRVHIFDHVYIAEDCGGAIKGNRIDVYFDKHEDALAFGVKRDVQIFIERGEENCTH